MPSDCTLGGDLKVTTGTIQGTAGSAYLPIIFTNTGGGPCGIEGYPGVSFANSAGQQIGAAATRSSSPNSAPKQLTLPAGGSAYAALQIGDPGMLGCKTQAIPSLRVYPPNETASVVLPYKSYASCQGTSVKQLHIQPVASGTGPS